jgi:hypothetical protein
MDSDAAASKNLPMSPEIKASLTKVLTMPWEDGVSVMLSLQVKLLDQINQRLALMSEDGPEASRSRA